MASATVKIDAETYARLKSTAEETGKPMIEVLAEAIDAYARHCFLVGLSATSPPCVPTRRGGMKSWPNERLGRPR